MARVLVVEPDQQIRKFIAGILADFGHQVEQCSDARDAERFLSCGRFDVLATDLVLAGRKGAELGAVARHLPVLTLTGRPFHPGVINGAAAARLNEKPFRVADLAALASAIGLAAEAA